MCSSPLAFFEMGNPTMKTFLRKFTRIAQEDHENSSLVFEFFGYYLAELSSLDYRCLKFLSLHQSSFSQDLHSGLKKHPWVVDGSKVNERVWKKGILSKIMLIFFSFNIYMNLVDSFSSLNYYLYGWNT